MEYQDLIFRVEDRIAYLTMNRPHVGNALNLNMKREMSDIVTRLETDSEIWGLIISGNGKAFSSGTDISEFPDTVEKARRITAFSQALFNRIENLNIPVIAAVNGYALGGGFELVLVCDLVVASEKARFGFPEVKIGAIPCYGGTQRLTRCIGAPRAKKLIFTGEALSAHDAKVVGLVSDVVEPGREVEAARELMMRILANSPIAVSYAKQCINCGPEIGLNYALDYECNLVSMLVPTHDLKEGSRAFLEKRAPEFLNR